MEGGGVTSNGTNIGEEYKNMGAIDSDSCVFAGVIGQVIDHYISPGALAREAPKILYRARAYPADALNTAFTDMEGGGGWRMDTQFTRGFIGRVKMRYTRNWGFNKSISGVKMVTAVAFGWLDVQKIGKLRGSLGGRYLRYAGPHCAPTSTECDRISRAARRYVGTTYRFEGRRIYRKPRPTPRGVAVRPFPHAAKRRMGDNADGVNLDGAARPPINTPGVRIRCFKRPRDFRGRAYSVKILQFCII